ncbi:chymotrypsin-like elastase family member 1 [Phlebotomus papatasi]|uniref:chymotrypsin-like elastase family member 1 n=1 Tax=Phlebotomus papatasi TaxID=29031 RepID=UPI00248458AB|nr:chymotrypsin-like elastase family member 1 [Phlebotomus papatasi]
MNSWWIALSVSLLGVWVGLAGATVPFQVSIRLYNDVYSAGQDHFHLCNGAIVHQNYVLTTGHCVKDTILFANSSRALTPQMIYVVAGNLSTAQNVSTATVRNVKKITIHKNYNPVTLEHDIALLELDQSLPLQNNTDVKWIQLDNGEVARSPCFISILNETNGVFKNLDNVRIIDMFYCNKSANFSSPKKDDICSQYTINGGSWCGTTDLQYKYSPDRGSALVCNKVLIGLLSSIEPSDDPFTTDCLQSKKTFAFYTTVEEYVPWINMVIGLTHGKPPNPPTTHMYGDKEKGASARVAPGIAIFTALVLVFMQITH